MHLVAGSQTRRAYVGIRCFINDEDVTNVCTEASEEEGFAHIFYSREIRLADPDGAKTYTRFGMVRFELCP